VYEHQVKVKNSVYLIRDIAAVSIVERKKDYFVEIETKDRGTHRFCFTNDEKQASGLANAIVDACSRTTPATLQVVNRKMEIDGTPLLGNEVDGIQRLLRVLGLESFLSGDAEQERISKKPSAVQVLGIALIVIACLGAVVSAQRTGADTTSPARNTNTVPTGTPQVDGMSAEVITVIPTEEPSPTQLP
jgi:hypothetical protein